MDAAARPASMPPEEAAVADEEALLDVRIDWEQPEPPIVFANAFYGLIDDIGDMVLLVGQIPPLVFSPDAAKRREEIRALATVPGRLIARVAVSPERIRRIIRELEELLGRREDHLAKVAAREATEQATPPGTQI